MTIPFRMDSSGEAESPGFSMPQSVETAGTSATQPLDISLLDLIGTIRMFSDAVEELVEARLQHSIAGERLSRSQWRLLEIFALTDVENVTDLATYQRVSTAAASKAVDRLVRLGLVTRAEDPDDRRHIRLALSEEGRRLIVSYLDSLGKSINRLFPQVQQQEANAITERLEDILSNSSAAPNELEKICNRVHLTRTSACLVETRLHGSCNYRMGGPHRARLMGVVPMTS